MADPPSSAGDETAPPAVEAVVQPASPTIFSDLLAPAPRAGLSVSLVLFFLLTATGLGLGTFVLFRGSNTVGPDGGVLAGAEHGGGRAAAIPSGDAGTMASAGADAGLPPAAVDAGMLAVPTSVPTAPPPQVSAPAPLNTTEVVTPKKPTAPRQPPGPSQIVQARAPATVVWTWRDYVVGKGSANLKVPKSAVSLGARDTATDDERRVVIRDGVVDWAAGVSTGTRLKGPAGSRPAPSPSERGVQSSR